ncbi:TRNA-processing ribonuclease BN [Gossypium australe]|uniref:tRNA-processing ribonuclease BN n=1 Tax=Gossypium australe TaxID=47621 RepID=A0A5B6X3P5_9ROSI|nr:TRNA-processing ribonuclease BN [Gossypium australe]
MELQPVCLGFPVPKFKFSTIIDSLFIPRNLTLISISQILKAPASDIVLRNGSLGPGDATRGDMLVEESKLMSASFQEDKGSFLWVLAPIALISSLILQQFFFSSAIEAFFKDETLVGILFQLYLFLLYILFTTIENCVLFFLGLGVFLLVTDHVQRPYLQFSAKRWGLITGLRVYLSSSFFTMGFKVVAPLLAVFLTWPALGFQALVAVAPFLIGCAAQHAFKTILDEHQSSCWPLIPIIF